MTKPELRLDWCSHEAAKYAVVNWHYSKVMPRFKLVKVGVWEDGQFIGCVLFGSGASNALGTPYGLTPLQTCELVRVALGEHKTPVTKIVSIAIKFLKRSNPGLRLIVSFADPVQGHHGGIYQGGNWIYSGKSAPGKVYYDANGIKHHSRNVKSHSYRDKRGTVNIAKSLMVSWEEVPGKHRYLYPLDNAMRDQITPLAKPYPKRQDPRAEGVESDTPSFHDGEGGAVPTSALQDGQPRVDK